MVVDVAGSPEATRTSVDLVKKRGTVVAPTVVGTEVATPLLTDKLVHREIKFLGVFASDARSIIKAIKLVESGKYPLEKIVTHKFPLEEAEKAVQITGGYFKNIYPIKCVVVP